MWDEICKSILKSTTGIELCYSQAMGIGTNRCYPLLSAVSHYQPVVIAQDQQAVLVAFGLALLVICRPITSSATVGWIPTTESNCFLVIPILKPMPIPWVTSPAFGEQRWNPTTLSSSAVFTMTFTYAVRFPSATVLSYCHSSG